MARRPLLLFLVALVAVLVTGVGTAGAHGEQGGITVVEAEQVSDREVRYVVRLVYLNDGDTASSADVSLIREGTDSVLTLAPLGDGLYEGTYEFPASGTFQMNFFAGTPAAELVHPQVIAAPTTTTTTTPPTTTTAPPSTTAATATAAAVDDGGDSGGLSMGPEVVIPAALVLAGAVGAALWAAGRRRGRPLEPA